MRIPKTKLHASPVRSYLRCFCVAGFFFKSKYMKKNSTIRGGIFLTSNLDLQLGHPTWTWTSNLDLDAVNLLRSSNNIYCVSIPKVGQYSSNWSSKYWTHLIWRSNVQKSSIWWTYDGGIPDSKVVNNGFNYVLIYFLKNPQLQVSPQLAQIQQPIQNTVYICHI